MMADQAFATARHVGEAMRNEAVTDFKMHPIRLENISLHTPTFRGNVSCGRENYHEFMLNGQINQA